MAFKAKRVKDKAKLMFVEVFIEFSSTALKEHVI